MPVQVVASYVFLFVMFGTLLAKAGGGEFFFDLASAATGNSRGGPAKVAVISSGLYGTMSGSPTSDVVATGSITIPIMKRLGYSKKFSGAVEVAASTGGSAMPPIMGSAAFILAEYTGTPYREIVYAALLPAFLYYIGVFLQVHLRAVREDLRPYSGKIPTLASTFSFGWPFLFPIAMIIGVLAAGYSPVFTAGAGALAVVLATLLSKRTRMTPVADRGGARRDDAAHSARGRRLRRGRPCHRRVVDDGSGHEGGERDHRDFWRCGLPDAPARGRRHDRFSGSACRRPSAYILAAVLVGPALTKIGFPILESHMFLLYYAILSALTPPIAVAALAAAAIADEDPFVIAFEAVRLAAVGFLMPFVFIWNPAIIGQGTVAEVLMAAAGGVMAACAIAVSFEWLRSHAVGRAFLPLKFLLPIGGAAAVAPNPLVSLVGIAATLAMFVAVYKGSPKSFEEQAEPSE